MLHNMWTARWPENIPKPSLRFPRTSSWWPRKILGEGGGRQSRSRRGGLWQRRRPPPTPSHAPETRRSSILVKDQKTMSETDRKFKYKYKDSVKGKYNYKYKYKSIERAAEKWGLTENLQWKNCQNGNGCIDDPLNFVKIKNPCGLFQTNLKADAWRVRPICFWRKKVFFWNTLNVQCLEDTQVGYSNFRNYAHPHFYRKYVPPPLFEGSFLKILW